MLYLSLDKNTKRKSIGDGVELGGSGRVRGRDLRLRDYARLGRVSNVVERQKHGEMRTKCLASNAELSGIDDVGRRSYTWLAFAQTLPLTRLLTSRSE